MHHVFQFLCILGIRHIVSKVVAMVRYSLKNIRLRRSIHINIEIFANS